MTSISTIRGNQTLSMCSAVACTPCSATVFQNSGSINAARIITNSMIIQTTNGPTQTSGSAYSCNYSYNNCCCVVCYGSVWCLGTNPFGMTFLTCACGGYPSPIGYAFTGSSAVCEAQQSGFVNVNIVQSTNPAVTGYPVNLPYMANVCGASSVSWIRNYPSYYSGGAGAYNNAGFYAPCNGAAQTLASLCGYCISGYGINYFPQQFWMGPSDKFIALAAGTQMCFTSTCLNCCNWSAGKSSGYCQRCQCSTCTCCGTYNLNYNFISVTE